MNDDQLFWFDRVVFQVTLLHIHLTNGGVFDGTESIFHGNVRILKNTQQQINFNKSKLWLKFHQLNDLQHITSWDACSFFPWDKTLRLKCRQPTKVNGSPSPAQ